MTLSFSSSVVTTVVTLLSQIGCWSVCDRAHDPFLHMELLVVEVLALLLVKSAGYSGVPVLDP